MTTSIKLDNILIPGFRLTSFQNISEGSFDENAQEHFSVIKAFEPIDILIDAEQYHLRKDQMIFIGPGRFIDMSNAKVGKGYMICFSALFYERSMEDTVTINSPLFFGDRPVLYDDTHFGEYMFKQQIVNRLNRANRQGQHIFELVAHHCIESLLLDVYHEVSAVEKMPEPKKTTDIGLVNHFSILIHKHCREYTNVQFYADQLHLTARKLTDLCLATTGKTAKSMILAVLVQQALRYLKHTNLSISQISYEMGFNDESNFRTFVKKQTGYIPLALRKN